MALHLKSTGIDFADYAHQGAMITELLDDYEEGTWVITNNGGAVTISTQNSMHYLKIARMIQLNAYCATNGDGDGNASTWGGLPGNAMHYNSTGIVNTAGGLTEFVILRTQPNTAIVETFKANQASVAENDVDNSHFIFTLNYKLYA